MYLRVMIHLESAGIGLHDAQPAGLGFRILDSGFWNLDLGFWVEGIENGIWSLGFRIQGPGLRVQGSGLRVQGPAFRVQGSGFRVWGRVSPCSTILAWACMCPNTVCPKPSTPNFKP